MSIALVGTGRHFTMKLLTAINFALRGSGLDPASDPTDENAEAGLAKEVIERTRREILETGFPFNVRKVTLQVDASGRVPVSSAYLDIDLPRGFTTRVDEGGDAQQYVWDIEDDSFHDEALERIPIVHDIEEFSQLPEAFGRWIARQSAVNFFTEHNSGAGVPGTLISARNEARAKAENSQPGGSIRTATRWAARLRRRIRT